MGKKHTDWLDEILWRIDSNINLNNYVDDEDNVHLYLDCWACTLAANRTPSYEPPNKWEVDVSTLTQALREAMRHVIEAHPLE